MSRRPAGPPPPKPADPRDPETRDGSDPDRQRKATGSQRRMISLFVLAACSLIAFAVIELRGVFDPATEDTFTEWVADLPLVWVLTIGGMSAVVGAFGIWSLGHYLEWFHRRKQ